MKLIDYKNDDLKSTNYNDYPLNITEASNHQLAFLVLKFLAIVEKIYLEETGETKPPPSHSVAVIPTHLVNPVADIYLYIMRPTEKTSTPFSLFRMPKKKNSLTEPEFQKQILQKMYPKDQMVTKFSLNHYYRQLRYLTVEECLGLCEKNIRLQIKAVISG
ncbi:MULTISPECIES: hypothetical protein [Carnobacterium]|uniref:hypothetical protein n=1 Tax=Carnobacterium TaxID=2747 RepID=UPI0007F545DE|nr:MULTISPECIES: hypothetical protein [Carnobacterium]MCO6019163.1 hypothetical protein [Carnobacterium divergens]MDT1940146.1 hypothetical protein [Carnobacterium divergens]MDT1942584.1 hypothetical protein [Carnobacterium divergens]MDT1948390.1 hypothetical protein [Carnobacterium divergens]MDT1950870.1 hypothetical protein [Carnobacterium divergens]